MDIAKFFTLFFLTVLSLSGCQSGTTKAETESPSHHTENPGKTWSVQLDMSGGFAGIQRRLTLDQSGSFQATDIKAGHTESGHVDKAALDKIEAQIKQLAASSSTPTPSTTSLRCADCIKYRIDATLDAQHYSRVSYSGSPSDPTHEALLSRLANLLKEALEQ